MRAMSRRHKKACERRSRPRGALPGGPPWPQNALVELREPSDHQLVGAAIKSRSGNVLRRPVGDVEAEIAAAEKAQRETRKKAREELR